ncbi:MAG: Holliday junction branch migration protein RuvA, partial [Spirochaetes bacterium]|nr:Holliday junction branch migration protein RuvA [Spirochaetota bacterium]
GLGKKTAEKLVFELRGRLDDIEIQNIQPGTGRLPVDAIAAMEALGFSEIKSRAAVFEALKEDGSSETEDIVKRALKHI